MRLKGGDPFVFGRGGEEALVCAEAGIPFAVVPGITAGVAAPAYAGVPVTHRDLASGVAFVTGHENPEKPETALDWPALAALPGDARLLHGRARAAADRRAADRRRPRRRTSRSRSWSRARCRGQRTLLATLGDVAERAAAEEIRAPAITLVGPVAALREQLAWLEARPLHGRSVTVTRARPQASALAARLRELGATVVEAPAIRVEPVAAALPDARRLRPGLRDVAERRARAVGAAGGGGARRAGAGRARGSPRSGRGPRGRCSSTACAPTSCPARAVAEGLVEALADVPVRRALLVRGREGRDVLPDALRARGAEVEVLVLYETVAEPIADAARAARARTT